MRPHENNRIAFVAPTTTTTTCRRNRRRTTVALALFASSSSRASSAITAHTTAAFSPPSASSFFFGAMTTKSTSTSTVVRDVSPPFLDASSSSEVTASPRHPPPTTTTTTSAPPTASVVQDFYDALDGLYDRSSSIKCPFFRRRAADMIDDAATVGRFLLIRHKSLPVVSDLLSSSSSSYDDDDGVDGGGGRGNGGIDDDDDYEAVAAFPVPPGCKPLGRHIGRDGAVKTRYASISDVARRIEHDWISGSLGPTKGYYITGKLDSTMYRDDCLFTGPDPDMPVRGLRKYLGAASHLFDARSSDATLLSLNYDVHGGESGRGLIEARWRLGGTIMLPWHPTVEPWTGTTRYHLDDEGLIKLHEERWDISVWRAFVCTLIPSARTWRIWGDADGTAVRV